MDPDELLRVRDHMRARGPDGAGAWVASDRRIGLGHRRLAIIDLSAKGAQPMASADGKLVISFNGEIYNYRQLRAALEAEGRVFVSDSDTEVLLHLYASKGIAMLADLRGMFAFALWESERGRLVLARDPFGIKPLYYADDRRSFRAASQVKALLQGTVDTEPEPAGQVGFLLWGSVPEPWTLYRGIRSLPAGHWLMVDANGVGDPVAWCTIGSVLANAAATPSNLSRVEAIHSVAEAIKDSVRAHQLADVPVGAFLSAGIDSGMIADIIAAPGSRPHLLTLGFAEYLGSHEDEVPRAEELARSLDAWQRTEIISRSDFAKQREPLLAAMDQPSIDGVNVWFVARAAAGMQLKAAMSGLGGDELFACYPSFWQLPRLLRFARPLRKLPRLGIGFRRLASKLAPPLPIKLAGLLEYSRDLGSAYLLRRCLHAPWELPALLGRELTELGLERLHTEAMLSHTIAGNPSERLRISALECSWYMQNQLLRDADWAGMAQSLEIRLPLADIELLRRSAPIFAAHPDIRKTELAAVAAPRLPRRWLHRRKTGFSTPLRDWVASGPSARRRRGLRDWAWFLFQQQGIRH